MAMEENQKKQLIDNLLIAVKDVKRYSPEYYSWWKTINSAVDSWYMLYGTDVIIDPKNHCLVYVD